MKIYKVYVNLEGRPFFGSIWAEIGRTFAKNKKDATDMIYQASWGIDNDVNLATEEEILHYVRNGFTLKAEIEQ